ncbi:MAG: hypothetical protein CMI30_08375 [Opitutae bacterium]|nr:hypothetical protein [Opitutae bacterium]|tara:strand:+ start:5300 stop:5740 length:441 start_codon:yes stop_codon:yes gene_type:complete
MKNLHSLYLFLAPLLACLLLSGCGASIESNTEDIVEELENLAEILDNIEDRDSAEDSIEDIEAIADNIKELRKERDDLLDEMSKSELRDLKDVLEDDYEDRFQDAFEDILDEEKRIREKSWGKEVLGATKKVGEQLMKIDIDGGDE